MKRCLSCVIAVALGVILFASCSQPRVSPENFLVPTVSYLPDGDREAIEAYLKNTLSIDQALIPQIYEESTLLDIIHANPAGDYGTMMVADVSVDYSRCSHYAYDLPLAEVLNSYPTKNVRAITIDGTDQTYLVYMTDEGMRLYLFFKDGAIEGYPIIMQKTLSYADFSGLSVGDPIEKVEEIDPVAAVYNRLYQHMPGEALRRTSVTSRTLTTNHLLTDGFLQIQYDRDKARNMTIREISFHDDFTVTNPPYEESEAWIDIDKYTKQGMFTHRYQILPKDYANGEVYAGRPASLKSAEEADTLSLSEVDWTVEVEGAEQTAFSLADAQKLSLTKIFAAYYPDGDAKNSLQSAIFQGVRFSGFLAAVGAPDARSVTVVDTDGKEHAVKPELIADGKTVLTWIMNKTLPVENSASCIAFAAQEGGPDDFVASVAKIILR